MKKDIESWRGGWIIINGRIFSTPNKENETLQLHPPSDLKGAAGPMEGKKIVTPSSKTGKKSDVKHQHKIRILQLPFAFFYCKSVGIYLLELMH